MDVSQAGPEIVLIFDEHKISRILDFLTNQRFEKIGMRGAPVGF